MWRNTNETNAVTLVLNLKQQHQQQHEATTTKKNNTKQREIKDGTPLYTDLKPTRDKVEILVDAEGWVDGLDDPGCVEHSHVDVRVRLDNVPCQKTRAT